ncbi:MAG: disulfide bond formation protein B [Pseudomonadota bacterium]
MTRTWLIVLGAGGSAALLLGAWGFQHIAGLAPCKMCIWQRWPHGAAMLIGPLALIFAGSLLPLMGAASALITAAIGVYHTGVERAWWEGPASCTSGSIEGLTPQELLAQITAAPVVQCDQVAWQMLGLSMASWNAVLSLTFAVFWSLAAIKSRP